MNRAEELIRELVSIPDAELKKVPVMVFSMLRGMVNRFSDDDTLGEHAGCRELIYKAQKRCEELEEQIRKLEKKKVKK